jgi:MFS family permease
MTAVQSRFRGIGSFRWIIVFLLFLITIFNYIDRAAISFAIGQITAEFHFDASAAGLVLGAFGIGYFITTFLGGIAVDRWGTRKVLLIAAVLWSIAMGGAGFAIGFATLFVARALLGLAEGPNFPSLTRAIGHWLNPQERATALAFTLFAVPLALAISAPIVTTLLVWFGWRGMFWLLGFLVLAWIPFWVWLFRDNPATSPHVGPDELDYIRAGQTPLKKHTVEDIFNAVDWKFILTNRTLVANTWAFFVFGYFLFFFMGWLPSYLERTYHLSLRAVGVFSFLPWAVAAVLLWGFGPLSDFLLRRTGRLRVARSSLIMLTQLGAALAVIPVTFAGDLTVAIIFISIAVGLSMSANSAYYATTIDVAPKRSGSALGVMDTAFAISGFVAPALTGYIVDLTGSFNGAFVLLTVFAVSSVIVVFLFHKPDESARLEVET